MNNLIENIILKAPKNLSETGTIFHLILPVFDYLGWKSGMVNNILFEDITTTNKRIDIKFTSSENSFLLEAKKIDHSLSDKDFEQLTNYLNSDNKVDIGILTNGIDYWIANNKKDGLSNKKIYQFSLNDFTSCDKEILETFKYPLSNLEDLNDLIIFQTHGKKLGKLNCENLHKSEEKRDLLELKSIEKNSISEINFLEKFDDLKESDFPNFSSFFQKKIYLAIKILEENEKDLNSFFEHLKSLFRKEKPNSKYAFRFIEKYNRYLYLNTNISEKRKQLLKVDDYLKKELS
jgi:predicted type IV restriction endonuclease